MVVRMVSDVGGKTERWAIVWPIVVVVLPCMHTYILTGELRVCTSTSSVLHPGHQSADERVLPPFFERRVYVRVWALRFVRANRVSPSIYRSVQLCLHLARTR